MAVGVSVGGDFDVHFVEAAFLVNASQIRSGKTGGGADGIVDRRQGNLTVLIKHNPACLLYTSDAADD